MTQAKVIFAINTVKALGQATKAEQAYQKSQGGLAQAILADARSSLAHLKDAVKELVLVIKGSNLSASTQAQYGKQVNKLGKTYASGADIPAGDLKSIYDAILEAAKTNSEVESTTTRKPKQVTGPKHSGTMDIGEHISLATLRSIPNVLAKQDTFSMKSKQLFQAFLVQIDLDFKVKSAKV